MAPAGQTLMHTLQPTHSETSIFATLFSTVMHFLGQTFTQRRQPMQVFAQASFARFPMSVLWHRTNETSLTLFFSWRLMSWRGQIVVQSPQPTHTSGSTTATRFLLSEMAL